MRNKPVGKKVIITLKKPAKTFKGNPRGKKLV